MKTALLIGSSGLVGRFLLEYLLEDSYYDKVIVLVRKSLNIQNKKLDERIIDFANLKASVVKCDHVYCTLGTTIKKAGSQDKFRLVDFEYPLIVAEEAHKLGATSYSLVTAIGANHKSSVFYTRVKGEVEQAIKALNFNSFQVYRPSFLAGNRDEVRKGESLGVGLFNLISPLMIGPLKQYAPIEAKVVAHAMISQGKKELKGFQAYNSDKINELI